jgi:flagellar biosynthetic protein FlhB
MPEQGFQERTERATPRKREQAREKGQVARSADISSVCVLLAGVLALYFFSHHLYRGLAAAIRSGLSFDRITEFSSAGCLQLCSTVLLRFLVMLLPVMGAVFLAALAANLIQVGFHLSGQALAPRLDKLSVSKGFGRLFSLRSLVELVKSLLKLGIVGGVAYLAVKGQSAGLLSLYDMSPNAITAFILGAALKLFLWVGLIMALVAALDYGFQRWKFEQELKMTKQEVNEEAKQAEGDPQIKARIRSIQQQAARKRMMQALPQADVVVTNPTHLAVAIKYDPLSMGAPQVVAKGAGAVAARIRQLAAGYGIPVVENKALARNLYKTVEPGREIPSELYRAVAELLAYVYRLKGNARR